MTTPPKIRDGPPIFFTEEVWTKAGLVTFYVLFFIHLGTCRVHIARRLHTHNPDSAWMMQQARNLSMKFADGQAACRYIIHDLDSSFLSFDFVIKTDGIRVVRRRSMRPCAMPMPSGLCAKPEKPWITSSPWESGTSGMSCAASEPITITSGPTRESTTGFPSDYEYPGKPADPKDVRRESLLDGLLIHYFVKKTA